jgi:hypothetical protein
MKEVRFALAFAVAGLVGCPPAAAAPMLAEQLNLVCSGTAETMTYMAEEHVVSQDGDVRVYLDSDGGTAELPQFIGGAKEGRLDVRLFSVGPTLITGKVNYRGIGNAKMRIDRLAGTIAITGPRGNFSGRCRPFDPAATKPQF